MLKLGCLNDIIILEGERDMSILEKVKLQQKYGAMRIKAFSECNPFGNTKDDEFDTLNDCIYDYQRWINAQSLVNQIIVISTEHYATISDEDGTSCDLIVKYLPKY